MKLFKNNKFTLPAIQNTCISYINSVTPLGETNRQINLHKSIRPPLLKSFDCP